MGDRDVGLTAATATGSRALHTDCVDLYVSLQEVVDATVEIFGAAGAGLMLIDDGQALRHVGNTDARSAAFEAAQEENVEGPCVDALVNDEIVETDDLVADPRWPFVTGAVGTLGIRAILAVPVHISSTPAGSLNVYRGEPSAWSDADRRAACAQVRVIEQVIGMAMLANERHEVVRQLERALESRVTIERAVGVIMARERVDPVRAFNRLRVQARSRRVRVAEVAAVLLAETDFLPAVEPQ